MLPLVGFLIYNSTKVDNSNYNGRKKKLKILELWFGPVILIPLMWPTYAISNGELENWLDGLSWQAGERSDLPIWSSLSDIYRFDPVLFAIGMSAIAYASLVKRDGLIILWLVPFVVFFYFVDHYLVIYLLPTHYFSDRDIWSGYHGQFGNTESQLYLF
jgi:hypothetical protein